MPIDFDELKKAELYWQQRIQDVVFSELPNDWSYQKRVKYAKEAGIAGGLAQFLIINNTTPLQTERKKEKALRAVKEDSIKVGKAYDECVRTLNNSTRIFSSTWASECEKRGLDEATVKAVLAALDSAVEQYRKPWDVPQSPRGNVPKPSSCMDFAIDDVLRPSNLPLKCIARIVAKVRKEVKLLDQNTDPEKSVNAIYQRLRDRKRSAPTFSW